VRLLPHGGDDKRLRAVDVRRRDPTGSSGTQTVRTLQTLGRKGFHRAYSSITHLHSRRCERRVRMGPSYRKWLTFKDIWPAMGVRVWHSHADGVCRGILTCARFKASLAQSLMRLLVVVAVRNLRSSAPFPSTRWSTAQGYFY
jgi:hypothetical protein